MRVSKYLGKSMTAAVNGFFLSGYDPLGQHRTPDDLAFSMQHELDLLAEGEDNELDSPEKVRNARQYVAKWKGITK